jgi:hypothetical protein
MATQILLSSATDLSTASTISSPFATVTPFASTSSASIQHQLRALLWSAEFGRKEMAIAALCGAASLACVYCGTMKSLGMLKRGTSSREQQREGKAGGGENVEDAGAGSVDGGDSSYDRPSTSSGTYPTSSPQVLFLLHHQTSNIGYVPVYLLLFQDIAFILCLITIVNSLLFFWAFVVPANISCTLLARKQCHLHVLSSQAL